MPEFSFENFFMVHDDTLLEVVRSYSVDGIFLIKFIFIVSIICAFYTGESGAKIIGKSAISVMFLIYGATWFIELHNINIAYVGSKLATTLEEAQANVNVDSLNPTGIVDAFIKLFGLIQHASTALVSVSVVAFCMGIVKIVMALGFYLILLVQPFYLLLFTLPGGEQSMRANFVGWIWFLLTPHITGFCFIYLLTKFSSTLSEEMTISSAEQAFMLLAMSVMVGFSPLIAYFAASSKGVAAGLSTAGAVMASSLHKYATNRLSGKMGGMADRGLGKAGEWSSKKGSLVKGFAKGGPQGFRQAKRQLDMADHNSIKRRMPRNGNSNKYSGKYNTGAGVPGHIPDAPVFRPRPNTGGSSTSSSESSTHRRYSTNGGQFGSNTQTVQQGPTGAPTSMKNERRPVSGEANARTRGLSENNSRSLASNTSNNLNNNTSSKNTEARSRSVPNRNKNVIKKRDNKNL